MELTPPYNRNQRQGGGMKRLAAAFALLIVMAVPLATANAGRQASRTICHRTGSTAKPYVRMVVSTKALKAHLKHAADIVQAGASCPTTVLTAKAGGTALPSSLTGEAESPAR